MRRAAAATWSFPPPDRPPLGALPRASLHELAARADFFEHHLVVVARAGGAQLELATASEPLYFAHVNISDEYALALPTGDPLLDGMPLRTFLADAAGGADVARYNHHAGDLVLHPLGLLHWPGRLRPPHQPFAFGPGMRRCALSLVFCGSRPCSAGERPLGVADGRAADAKPYASPAPPLGLCDLGKEPARIVARVGDATLELLVAPRSIAAPRACYVVVLQADAAGPHHPGDLVHLPAGAALDGAGIARALRFASDAADAEPPPPSWQRPPAPPIAPFEDRPPGALPFAAAGLTAAALDDSRVAVTIGAGRAEVPRYWLARMLFRVALHAPPLGYLETYGGFWYDDRAVEQVAIGLRDGESIVLAPGPARALVESLYRAVAPVGYTERL